MKVPKSSSNYPLMKPGAYAARIVGVLNAGEQDEEFQGVPRKANKIIIRFEFPTQTAVFKEGSKPEAFVVTAEYTFSLSLRAKTTPKFKKLVESLRGVPIRTQADVDKFDPEKMLNFPCLIMVGQKVSGSGSTYNTIEAASPMDKNACPPATTPLLLWEPEHGVNEVFKQLPPWVQDKLASGHEFQALFGNKANSQPDARDSASQPDPQPEAPPADWQGGSQPAEDDVPF